MSSIKPNLSSAMKPQTMLEGEANAFIDAGLKGGSATQSAGSCLQKDLDTFGQEAGLSAAQITRLKSDVTNLENDAGKAGHEADWNKNMNDLVNTLKDPSGNP